MTIAIRAATAADATDIHRIHAAAFETSAEADLVDRLRREGAVAISLIAQDGDELVGHVLFSRIDAKGDGKPLRAAGLLPSRSCPNGSARASVRR